MSSTVINSLYMRFQRPEKGWDPISASYGAAYDVKVSADEVLEIMSFLGRHIRIAESSFLDVGGGPGQFSCAAAKGGAEVTWYDVSRTYEKLALERASRENVSIRTHIGYMDEIDPRTFGNKDIVFNRVCWYYCSSDKKFAEILAKLPRPGGFVFVETNISTRRRMPFSAKLRQVLFEWTGLKIGHPYPKRGSVESLLAKNGLIIIEADYTRDGFDRVLAKAPERGKAR